MTIYRLTGKSLESLGRVLTPGQSILKIVMTGSASNTALKRLPEWWGGAGWRHTGQRRRKLA